MHINYLKKYKEEFRHYIYNNKENTHLSTITINPSELYCNSTKIIWEDKNKEVIYKGVLYDVVKINFNGLTVELIVVSDEQEMEIKKHFASLYNIDSHAKTKVPFNLIKSFLSLKCIVTSAGFTFYVIKSKTNSYLPIKSFKLSSKFTSKNTPPPKYFS